jgi:hypothetical protein
MWVGDQCHITAVLPPGKSQYPLYSRLGGPQGLAGCVQKTSLPLGLEPHMGQTVVSHLLTTLSLPLENTRIIQ